MKNIFALVILMTGLSVFAQTASTQMVRQSQLPSVPTTTPTAAPAVERSDVNLTTTEQANIKPSLQDVQIVYLKYVVAINQLEKDKKTAEDAFKAYQEKIPALNTALDSLRKVHKVDENYVLNEDGTKLVSRTPEATK